MKLNWGHYIAIFLVAFMLFILSFVYKAVADDRYDHKIIDNYYEKEIKYQDEIDAVDNAKKLENNILINRTEDGVVITFPKDINNISGTVVFERPSNEKLDFSIPIKLEDNRMVLPKEKLVDGLYNVIINWSANDTKYLYKEKFSF